MSATRAAGFYWVRVGTNEPEIMRFELHSGEHSPGYWYPTGSEDTTRVTRT